MGHSLSYDLATSLDPGEEYDCEIGIPAGFALSQSRTTPFTLSLKMLKLGIEEWIVVQDIKRRTSLVTWLDLWGRGL